MNLSAVPQVSSRYQPVSQWWKFAKGLTRIATLSFGVTLTCLWLCVTPPTFPFKAPDLFLNNGYLVSSALCPLCQGIGPDAGLCYFFLHSLICFPTTEFAHAFKILTCFSVLSPATSPFSVHLFLSRQFKWQPLPTVAVSSVHSVVKQYRSFSSLLRKTNVFCGQKEN